MKVGDLVYRNDHDEKEWRPIYIIVGIDHEFCGGDTVGWKSYLIRRIRFFERDDIIPFFANGLEVINEGG